MLDVKLNDQTYTFLCSLLSGLMLGALYSLFKCVRCLFSNGRTATIILDILYMILFTLVTTLFSIGFTEGFVRYFVVAGESIGVLTFRFTFGLLIDKLFAVVFDVFSKIKRIFQKIISVFLKKLLKARHKMLYNKVNKKAKSAN